MTSVDDVISRSDVKFFKRIFVAARGLMSVDPSIIIEMNGALFNIDAILSLSALAMKLTKSSAALLLRHVVLMPRPYILSSLQSH